LRGFHQDRSERFGNRATGLEDLTERHAVGAGVALKDTSIEPGLAPEGSVEAGRIDAERVREIGDADVVVAARVKQALGDGDSVLRVKAARAAAGAR
jgi:hypothetical protein